jgi:hypothetical protein
MRVGYGRSPDPVSAVRQAAATLGPSDTSPGAILAFSGGKLDPFAVRAALADTFGPVPVVVKTQSQS